MQERLKKATTDIREKWDGLDKQQKVRFSLGAAVLVLAIALTIFITVKPKMYVLLGNKDITTISKVQAALDDAGIPNKIIDNGRSIQVKKKDSFAAQVAIETNTDINAADFFTYDDMFEKGGGIGVSESTKKAMENLAKANEIASVIQKMDGVEEAKVILNTPESNGIFLRDSQIASATVYITESKSLDKSQAQAVAEAVASGVQGLSKENVTIINQSMETVYSGDSQGAGSTNSEYDLEMQKKNEIKFEVLSQLSPLYDDVKVSANLVFDWNKTSSISTEYEPYEDGMGIPRSESIIKEEAQGTSAGAEVGLGANDNVADNYGTGDNQNSSASRNETIREYNINERVVQVEESTGNLVLDDSTLSVFLYKYKTIDEKFMTENNRLDGLTWAEYKDQKVPEKIEVDDDIILNIASGTGFGLDNISVVGYELYYFQDEIKAPIDWQQVVLIIILTALILMLAYGLIRRNQPDEEIIDMAPELSVEDLLVSTQLEEAKEAEVNRLKDIDYTKESEVKRQIDKFVDEKPEAVAQLLRNWLNEGWE